MVPPRSAGPVTQRAAQGLVEVQVESDGRLQQIEIADGWEQQIPAERLVGVINAAIAAAQARLLGHDGLVPPAEPDALARFQAELAATALEVGYAPGLDLDLLARRFRDDPQSADEALAAAFERIDAGLAAGVQTGRDQESEVAMNTRRTLGFVLEEGRPVALQADPRWPSGSGGRLSRELNEFLSQL